MECNPRRLTYCHVSFVLREQLVAYALFATFGLIVRSLISVDLDRALLTSLFPFWPLAVKTMSSGRYAPLPTSSADSVDHQYKQDDYDDQRYDSPWDRRPAAWQYGGQRELGIVEKGKRHYWAGKQYVREKMGKEQDQHQVADDAELDSQMERARHIQKQCLALCRALLRYQEVVQLLTSRQVALSSLLRAYSESETDAPCAEMMSRLGTVMQDEAVSRLELDVPLTRFFSEVETFRCRALVDTLINVNQVTQERRKFRGALLWMADASKNLDPDTRKHLAKFRQAQQMARESRQEFEGKKGVVCEKVDLLGASFCNLLSHAMTPYQKVVGQQWSKSAEQYRQLLDWSRETLRHQYRLRRDVLRDKDRLLSKDDEDDAEQAEGVGETGQGHTSESWSEGRLLTILGKPVLASKVEDAEDALGSQADTESTGESQAKIQESVPAEGGEEGDGDHTSKPMSSNSQAVQLSASETSACAQRSDDWLQLMTEGSAASALADFANDKPSNGGQHAPSQIHKALLDLARVSTGGDVLPSGQSSDQIEAMLSYEMSSGDQRLQDVQGIRQLTNDEGNLDQLVPMDSNLRRRQELDVKAETQLEEELARMVHDFSSLSSMSTSLGSEKSENFPSASSYSVPNSAQMMPGDLLDFTDGSLSSGSAGSLFSGMSPFSQTSNPISNEPRGDFPVASKAGDSGGKQAKGGYSHPAQDAKSTLSGAKKQKWFDLFSELDPLANPDDLSLDQDNQKSDDGATDKLAL